MEPQTFKLTHGQWEAAFYDQVSSLLTFGADNKESIAELVLSFFDYWHRHHDWKTSVVCVRTGGLLSKATKGWDKRVRFCSNKFSLHSTCKIPAGGVSACRRLPRCIIGACSCPWACVQCKVAASKGPVCLPANQPPPAALVLVLVSREALRHLFLTAHTTGWVRCLSKR